jgi:hypothetical protein
MIVRDDAPHKGHSKNKTSCSPSTGCLSNSTIVVEQTVQDRGIDCMDGFP